MTSEMSSKQIKQREKKDPHDDDKVPVETRNLYGTVVFGTVTSFSGEIEKHRHYTDTDDQVERVHPGHREVDPVKHLHMSHGDTGRQLQVRVERIAGNQSSGNEVIDVLFVILNGFDAKKHEAQPNGDCEVNNLCPQPAELAAEDCHRHRQAAKNQHGSVDCAQFDVKVITGDRKRLRVF